MLFGDLWAHYSLRLGKVESENPRCSAAEKCGHLSGMRVIQDLGIAEVPISDRGKSLLISGNPLPQVFKPVYDNVNFRLGNLLGGIIARDFF